MVHFGDGGDIDDDDYGGGGGDVDHDDGGIVDDDDDQDEIQSVFMLASECFTLDSWAILSNSTHHHY